MSPLFQAIRSVAAEFARRLYVPIAITTAIALITLLVVSLWLTTVSDWWWILAVTVIGITLLATIILAIVGGVIRMAAPSQSRPQRKRARQVVDGIQRLAEVTATPKFVLFFQVVRDVVAPSNKGFIASVTDDTSSIQRDFNALKESFQ